MGDEPSTTDVLVVGAGPTGLLLTNLLGAMGVRTTLVEANETTVQEPRAVSIDDESMRALQAADLHRQVQAISAAGYGSIYRGPSGRIFATVKPSTQEYGFEKRNAFQQPELEALLREGLSRFRSVSACFGMELTSFDQDDGHVTAGLRSTEGRRFSMRAHYLVACDGGRSPVRKALGVRMQGSSFQQPWLIVDLESTRNRCFHTEVFCDPNRPAITLPGPGGERRYEFMLHPGENPDTADLGRYARELLEAAGPDAGERIRRVRVYTFHARIADRWRVNRVFLAGDAAHLTPPFAGQGMNSGLRDAHNLAWKLDEALRASTDKEFLDSYETERKPHAWSLIQLAMRMGRIMMPSSRVQAALVRGAFRTLGLYPPAREYVAQMRYKPKPRFREGLLWPDGQSSHKTLVGRMIPQPMVEDADRDRFLLDEVLPDRPVLLIYSEMPDQAVSTDIQRQFEDAGTAVIGLTPEWNNPPRTGIPSVRDRSRLFSSMTCGNYLEHALLVRRDRYVAAARPVASVEELLTPAKILSPGQT